MQFEPGTTVGAYRVEEQIGSGSFGDVYRAHRADDSEPVALKLLSNPQIDDEQLVGSVRLEHPNIVRTLEVFRQDHRVCLVQEWADGGTLEDQLGTKPFGVADVVRLGIDVASALAHAHERGIVHRDVKPSNVLVASGNYKLGDFGISAALEVDTGLTAVGQIAGTPLYMSPEQALGRPLSPASDIFGLGMVLYRVAYGSLPGEAGHSLLKLLDRRVRQQIEVPPSPFQSLIQQCLALDPADRPQAIELADQLSRQTRPGGPFDQATASPASAPPSSGSTPKVTLDDVQDLSAAEPAAPAPPPPGGVPIDWRQQSHSLPEAQAEPGRRLGLAGLVLILASFALGVFALVSTRISSEANRIEGLPGQPSPGPGWAWALRLVLAGILVIAGLRLSRHVREHLARKVPEIERRATDVLFEEESRIELTQSLTIEVDEVVRRLRTIDGRILGMTLRAMVDEYDTAKASSDRIAALVNVVTIMEKLRVHLSPWHVRHKEVIATSVAVVGCLSGVASVVSGFLT